MHGGLPLLQRFPREAQLALYNATHGKLQDVHPKRFRKLAAFCKREGLEAERAFSEASLNALKP